MNMDLIEFGWLLSHVVFLICRLKMRCLICLLIAAMIGWADCTADADAQVNEQADVDRPGKTFLVLFLLSGKFSLRF